MLSHGKVNLMRHIGQDVPKRHTHFVLESRLMYEKSFRDAWLHSVSRAVAQLDEPLAKSLSGNNQKMLQRKMTCFLYNQYGLFKVPYHRIANVDRYYAVQGVAGTREWVPYANVSHWTMNKMFYAVLFVLLRMFRFGLARLGRVIRVGDVASARRVISQGDVKAFGLLIGDANPIHADESVAQAAGFPCPIAHGMLAGSLFSGLLGSKIPGPQSIYLSQTLRFVAPVLAGDEVEARVSVMQFKKSRSMIAFRTTVSRIDRETGRETLCVEGTAVAMNKTVTFEGESEWTIPRMG